jgi:hypothetical protein
MDGGIPEPDSSELSKETNEPPAVNGETLKNETPVVLESTESCKADTAMQKSSQEDTTEVTVTGDKMTRKSKPSVDSVRTNTGTPLTKNKEPEPEAIQTEPEGTSVENSAEGTPTAVEAVKPKVKTKKKVLNSNKSEDTSKENSQNSGGAADVIESSLKAPDKSNLEESSSLKSRRSSVENRSR